jgi:hypothetical protein
LHVDLSALTKVTFEDGTSITAMWKADEQPDGLGLHVDHEGITFGAFWRINADGYQPVFLSFFKQLIVMCCSVFIAIYSFAFFSFVFLLNEKERKKENLLPPRRLHMVCACETLIFPFLLFLPAACNVPT